MRVSVIISVYNVEKYLVNNLESMIEQSDEAVEFIYVNDGSTDHSLDLINSYQANDNRIKIVTQENGGLSAARNRGIQEATGEIVVFVDGDDYIAIDALEILSDIMLKYDLDILQADGIRVQGMRQSGMENSENITLGSIVTGMDLLIKKEAVFTGCFYVYRRTFLEKYNLLFEPGILHEDMDFVPRALYYAKRVMKIDYAFYYHVMREGSITNSANIQRSRDLFQIANKIECFADAHPCNKNEIDFFVDYCCSLCAQAIHVAVLNGFKLSELFGDTNTRKNIIRHMSKGSTKYKIASFLFRIKMDTVYGIAYKLWHSGKSKKKI